MPTRIALLREYEERAIFLVSGGVEVDDRAIAPTQMVVFSADADAVVEATTSSVLMHATARWWPGRLAGTRISRRVERALTRPSLPLNDEDCFVVNPVFFSSLPQMVVVFCSVFQHCSADVSR